MPDAGLPDAGPPDAGLPEGCADGEPFTVTERAGVDRPDGLLVAGAPLARAAVFSTDNLMVCDGQQPIPASFTAASYWHDGSLRWVTLAVPLTLSVGETRTLVLARGSSPAREAPAPAIPALTFHLKSETGTLDVPVTDGASVTRDGHQLQVDVEALTQNRVRVRTYAAQLEGESEWADLWVDGQIAGSAHPANGVGAIGVGALTAAIRHPGGRGPMEVSYANGTLRLDLYPETALPPYPADPGFHVSHEIILEGSADATELAARVAMPLRAAWDPDYVARTGAAGDMTVSPERLDPMTAPMRASIEALRSRQQLPGNHGMSAWGDFTADEGYSYMGYYNQEYDPATALFRFYLATGDLPALDFAQEMSRQYADNSVGLSGGVYQHRSTTRALMGVVGKAAAAALVSLWRDGQAGPAADSQIAARTAVAYSSDDTIDQAVRSGLADYLATLTDQGVTDPAERERQASWWLGYKLSESALEEAKSNPAAILDRVSLVDPTAAGRLSDPSAEITALDHARIHRAASALVPLEPWMSVAIDDPAGVDTLYAPFFARYGGGWGDFPRFLFYDIPDVEENHHGSHTLVEMLVWSYLLTGDLYARRAALRVADDFIAPGGLLDRSITAIEEMNHDDEPVHIRTGSWALICALSLRLLTPTLVPDVDAALEAHIERLVQVIVDVKPKQYEGVIHAGVTAEALARFHAAYRDALPDLAQRALDRVVETSVYWAQNQWSDSDQRFFYRQDDPEKTLDPGSYLMMYGMSYALRFTDSADVRSLLESRISALRGDAGDAVTTPKALGMKFRNSLR